MMLWPSFCLGPFPNSNWTKPDNLLWEQLCKCPSILLICFSFQSHLALLPALGSATYSNNYSPSINTPSKRPVWFCWMDTSHTWWANSWGCQASSVCSLAPSLWAITHSWTFQRNLRGVLVLHSKQLVTYRRHLCLLI